MPRPITMVVVALYSAGALVLARMRVGVFPPLSTPRIYVLLDYIGMSPDQVEGFIGPWTPVRWRAISWPSLRARSCSRAPTKTGT
jgi:Cu/Ag efflux pump CusA